MATTLTYPERATLFNMRRLREAVLAGHASWPGANFVEKLDGSRIFLSNDKVRGKGEPVAALAVRPCACCLLRFAGGAASFGGRGGACGGRFISGVLVLPRAGLCGSHHHQSRMAGVAALVPPPQILTYGHPRAHVQSQFHTRAHAHAHTRACWPPVLDPPQARVRAGGGGHSGAPPQGEISGSEAALERKLASHQLGPASGAPVAPGRLSSRIV